jgi:hypothetical protein
MALVLGLVFTAIAAVLLARDLAATGSYGQAEGTIVLDRRTEFPSRESARVRFSTGTALIEFECTLGNHSMLRRGDTMEVLYDPEDPTHARPAGLAGMPPLILVLGIPGLVALVSAAVAGVSLRIARRRSGAPGR